MWLQWEWGAGKVGWDNIVLGESANSSQGCTLNTAMLVELAGTALYKWVVRVGATGWWGISPLGKVLWCCLRGAKYWRCQETLLSLNANHKIASSCKYILLKEGERVSSQKEKHDDPRDTVSCNSWQTRTADSCLLRKPLWDCWGALRSQWQAVW